MSAEARVIPVQIRRLILNDVGPFGTLELSFPEGKDPERADVHLLVGPNGTGKSSVLAAIAQCFSVEEVGLERRFRTQNGWFVLDTSVGWGGAFRLGFSKHPRPWMAFADVPEIDDAPAQLPQGYQRVNLGLISDYLHTHTRAMSILRSHSMTKFAAFAYSGLRSTEHSDISGIQEQTDNPLRNACLLHRTEGTRDVAQWIANTVAREAMYAQSGDKTRSADRKLSIDRLKRALGEVTGSDVSIVVEFDPFEVRIGIGGAQPCPISALPDGLQSLLSWLGDLLMRLDRIPWATPGPVTDRPFVLLLDEVEVHLHPAWQRRVLPMVERLFPNAQIIASTHSPFVIGSASDAWIHPFRLEGDHAVVDPPVPSAKGTSVAAILDQLMGVHEEFDVDSEEKLTRFRALWHQRLKGEKQVQPELESIASELRGRGAELGTIVETELRELRRRLGQDAAR